jgi:glycine betaine/proline transport system substrate-binding protein
MKIKKLLPLFSFLVCCIGAVHAQVPESAACEKVRFSTVGWSDIEATTAVTTFVLNALGYKTEVLTMSVPETFAALKSKKADVFLGYWSPTQDSMVQPLLKDGSIKVLEKPNLENARYTLAVPEYLYDQGLKSFADIAKFKTQLEGKIYGIEAGNDGNVLIQKMITADQFGLKGFKVVDSSETGMLDALNQAERAKKPIVFLGWEPHPMNLRLRIKYLSGGDDVFGPNFGSSKVYTLISKDLDTNCPNLYTFLKNFRLTADQESWIMLGTFESSKTNNVNIGKKWVKVNKEILKPWLNGVFDRKGGNAESAVRAALNAP